MDHTQQDTKPLTVKVTGFQQTHIIEVGIGRDMVVTFQGSKLVMLEVNGLTYAPINAPVHDVWYKSMVKGGLDPILKDAPVIDKMVMDYLFDAAIKTRLGAKENQ